MVGGRGVRLAPSSGVHRAELFLCVDVDAGPDAKRWCGRRRPSSATGCRPSRCTTRVEVVFRRGDGAGRRAASALRFDDLRARGTPAAAARRREVARACWPRPPPSTSTRVLPPDDSPAGLFLTRVRCLREWMPELELPAFDDAELRELLTWLCHGCRSFAELRSADWLERLQGRLTHAAAAGGGARSAGAAARAQRQPDRAALRSRAGRRCWRCASRRCSAGATRRASPAAGCRVLLHLLAPNYRPQQVTDDLASFWANTYPQVRKELRARYPKHAWPEDPWNAPPESRPGRKRRGE